MSYNTGASIKAQVQEVLKSRQDANLSFHPRLELLARRVGRMPYNLARETVQIIVNHTKHTKTPIGPQLLAWLLVYKVVEPDQVLQAIRFTQHKSIIQICGTSEFNPDDIESLGLTICKGKSPQTPVDNYTKRILVGFNTARKSNLARPTPQAYEPPEQNDSITDTKKRKKSNMDANPSPAPALEELKADTAQYESRVRKILMSTMSAEEAVHKILAMFSKNTESSVTSTILKACYEGKMYNRIYGNIANRLFRSNQRVWQNAWTKCFIKFYLSDCESVDADRLKVAGAFFGHLFSVNALNWKDAFSVIKLDTENSTPSTRILFLATVEELKASIGTKAVETRILGDEMKEAASGVIETELASGFWDLAGYKALADACE